MKRTLRVWLCVTLVHTAPALADDFVLVVPSRLSATTLQWDNEAKFQTTLDLEMPLEGEDFSRDDQTMKPTLDLILGKRPRFSLLARPIKASSQSVRVGNLLSVMASTERGAKLAQEYLLRVKDGEVTLFPRTVKVRHDLGDDLPGSRFYVTELGAHIFLEMKIEMGKLLHELVYMISLATNRDYQQKVKDWMASYNAFIDQTNPIFLDPNVILMNRTALIARLQYQDFLRQKDQLMYRGAREAYDDAYNVVSELTVNFTAATRYYNSIKQPGQISLSDPTPNRVIVDTMELDPDHLTDCPRWIATNGLDGP